MRRNDPFRELDRFLSRIGFDQRQMLGSPTPLNIQQVPRVAVNLSETDDTYEVVADLPGYRKDELTVHIKGKHLRVSAESSEDTDSDRTGTWKEPVERDITLPGPVNADEAETTYKNGVLTISIPKDDAGETKIDIS